MNDKLRRALVSAIRARRLPSGSTLPPSRMLAADLGCSRWVVTEAYGQLIAQGYLEARTGSATRVTWSGSPRTHRLPASTRRQFRFDLGPGTPDLRAFPRQRWLSSVRAATNQASFDDLDYPQRGGHPKLRFVLADYLTRLRGASVEPEDVSISTSITEGVNRMCQVLREAGFSMIAIEDPCWERLEAAVRIAGLTPVPIAVDEHGLRIDDLAARPEVRAVIIAPSHQFPTATALAPSRRASILEWARRTEGIVLEDDYDAEFRYDRRPIGAMQGMDPSHVVLLGSLSKTMSPALRIGWIVAPPRWTESLRHATASPAEPPTLDQLALANFIETGAFDRHMRWARKRYRARRDTLVRVLTKEMPQCRISGIAAGLHFLLHLPDGADAAMVVTNAASQDVRAQSLDSSPSSNGMWRDALVLGYGNMPDDLMPEAIRRLALAVRES